MKKFLRGILLSINIGVVTLLLLCYAGGVYNPSTKLGMGLYIVTLAYPIIALLNIGFSIFWLYRKKWYFLFSLLGLGFGYNTFTNTFPIHFTKKELPPPAAIKVLSYNVGGFYRGVDYNETVKDIVGFVKDEYADIVCIQELMLTNTSKFKFTEADLFTELKSLPYKAINYTSVKKYNSSGHIILSKYPIFNKGVVDIGQQAYLNILYADINVKGTKIRVFCPHLNPNRLKKINNTFYDELSQKDQDALKGEMKYILKSLWNGAHLRGDQVRKFKEFVDESPYPVIIAGDFNDTPGTYSYKTMRSNLKDAMVKNSSGMGATYNGNYPSFRIDYILHSPCLKSFAYKKYNRKASDHDPISCFMDITGCK